MLSTVLKFLPLLILGRAGLCKLNVVAPPQVQQVLEEVCIARQEIPLWSSSQNLDDWSNAWAKHWNARLAQQFDVIHELSGTRFAFSVTARQLLLAIGVIELWGWLSLFTNPRHGGLLLFLVMLGAIDTHVNGFGQAFEQVVPQTALCVSALFVALTSPTTAKLKMSPKERRAAALHPKSS